MLQDLRNAETYPIKHRWEGKNGSQVFLYGVPNLGKARVTTIFPAHFPRIYLDFKSMVVLGDQAEIPRPEKARESDVGGAMVSSLASSENLRWKLERRMA